MAQAFSKPAKSLSNVTAKPIYPQAKLCETGLPFPRTVHAPQMPIPQLILAPVKCRRSGRYHSRW